MVFVKPHQVSTWAAGLSSKPLRVTWESKEMAHQLNQRHLALPCSTSASPTLAPASPQLPMGKHLVGRYVYWWLREPQTGGTGKASWLLDFQGEISHKRPKAWAKLRQLQAKFGSDKSLLSGEAKQLPLPTQEKIGIRPVLFFFWCGNMKHDRFFVGQWFIKVTIYQPSMLPRDMAGAKA